jgi:hypothetical protein
MACQEITIISVDKYHDKLNGWKLLMFLKSVLILLHYFLLIWDSPLLLSY